MPRHPLDLLAPGVTIVVDADPYAMTAEDAQLDELVNVAFASGTFVHDIRTTGKPYASDWALKIIVKDGKILEYHFYEDSQGFVEACKN